MDKTAPLPPLMAETPPDKVWNGKFINIFFANFLMFAGIQLVNTLIAKYARTLTDRSALVGMVSSAFAVTAIAFRVVAAPALNSFKKRNILITSLSVVAAAMVGFSLARTIPALMICRMLQGAGMAFCSTSFLTSASDVLPPDKFATGIGYFSLGQAVAQACGPSLGLFLVGRIGFTWTFRISAMLMLCSAAAASRIKSKAPSRKFTLRGLRLSDIVAKEALLGAALLFLFASATHAVNSFMVIFAESKGIMNIGLYFTVYALTLLISRPFSGKMADKLGISKMLMPAALCFASSFFIFSVSSKLWMFLIGGVINAFGFGIAHPLSQAYVMKTVTPERRGVASCTGYIGQDLGMLCAPTVCGALADAFGYPSMWRMMTVPIFTAFVLILLFRKKIDSANAQHS